MPVEGRNNVVYEKAECPQPDWTLSARKNITVLSPDQETVFSFDLEGRPVSWYRDDRIYKRSLASRIHTRQRLGGRRVRAVLPEEDAAESYRLLLEQIASASIPTSSKDDHHRLQRILAWTPERLLDEKHRFNKVYRPVSILPPDQYLAVVLQATFGCTWNRCTFCSFYQDREFSCRTIDEFEDHCAGVKQFLGEGLKLRRSIFLADGNALVLSRDRLFPIMETAAELFPGLPVHGFVDVFSGERRTAAEWSELRELGLERVHVGLETGSDALLAWLNKPGSAEESFGFVSTLKEAGLKVALIFMVGAGGRQFAAAHRETTVALAERLPLQKGDIVYLSPFQPDAAGAYQTEASDSGIEPFTDEEIDREFTVLQDRIRQAAPGPIVTRYDIREFLY